MFLDGNAQYYTSISSQINPYFNLIPIKISIGIFYGSLQKPSDKPSKTLDRSMRKNCLLRYQSILTY